MMTTTIMMRMMLVMYLTSGLLVKLKRDRLGRQAVSRSVRHPMRVGKQTGQADR